MRALVVGGNGFIGSHLVDRLAGEGWEVRVLDLYQRRYDAMPPGVHFIQGDLTQTYLLREALNRVEVVYHLSWASFHEASLQDLQADVQANLLPSIQLLETCRWAEVQRVVFVSSGGTVYGPARLLPIPEEHPEQPVNSYGILKLAVEKYLQMFKHLYELDYAILRPTVPYGPRQNPLGRQGAVAVFTYNIAHGLPLQIWGDGSTSRDFFYISDLIDALVACASAELGEHPVFNIGGEEELGLLELAARIEVLVGRKAQIEFHPARRFDAQCIRVDTQRAREVLGWRPRISIEEGLARTWEWMKGINF